MMDYDDEMSAGMLAGLRGALDAAVAGYERARAARPGEIEPALQLLDLYPRVGRVADAEAVGADLLARAPNDPSVRLGLARLREETGRIEEALDLIRDGGVNLTPSGNAYPDYLRMLVGGARWEEASINAGQAINAPSLWRPHALLAKALSALPFGEAHLVHDALDQLDVDEHVGLVDFWVDRLKRAGVIAEVRRLLDAAIAQAPRHERLASLRERFAR